MWKILKSSIHNRILLAVFFLILIVNIFSLLSVNSVISKSTNELLSVLSIPATIILTVFVKPKNNILRTNSKNSKMKCFVGLIDKTEMDLKEERVLKRINHRENIVKKVNELFKFEGDAKGLVITGESGAGKSILLSFLKDDFKNAGYYVYFNDEYNVLKEVLRGEHGVPSRIEMDKKYVLIFDQFEGYLDFNAVENWLCKHRGAFKNCVFVFSFPQKFLTGIYNKVRGKFEDFNLQTYVLYLNKEDEDEYLKKIARVSNKDFDLIENKWKSLLEQKRSGMYNEIDTYGIETVLLEELYDVKHGDSPLIEMEFLGKMVEESYGGQDITRKNFIEYKFDRWAKCLHDVETAYAILALFTKFKSYGIEDIKHVTFDPANKFDEENNGEIIELLDSTDFLIPGKGSTQIDDKSSNGRQFAPKHEYVCGAIQAYLASKEVPVGLRNYVEYYRANAQFKEYRRKIRKRYKEYNQSHILINVLLYVMLGVIFLYNVLCIYSESDNLDIILHRVSFTCISFCSVFLYL